MDFNMLFSTFLFFCAFVVLFLFVSIILILLFWNPKQGMIGPRVIYRTLGRDLNLGYKYLKIRIFVSHCNRKNYTTASLFQRVVKKHPQKICFLCDDQKWTFQQVEDYSNQVANYFHLEGFQKGDEVAIFMQNRPEYICIWLGLSKIGVIPALINTNLIGHSLAHSINVVNCKAVIFGTELSTELRDVFPLLDRKANMKFYNTDNSLGIDTLPFLVKFLNDNLTEVSSKPPDIAKHKINCNDILLYIYTSGTTGLPKAVIFRHSRLLLVAAGTKYLMGIQDTDVFYNPLPMYHAAGGLLFVSTLLTFGGTMAIRKKFSASNFWEDAIKYKATVSQYIGEICRYLLAQPKKPQDTEHKIRLMTGNGLRSHIWKEFVKRFEVKQIFEIYGSTEGNANVVNTTGKVGAVGFLSRVFGRIYPVSLIKVDPESGNPIRDKNGLCIHCKPGEPGEMVGKIVRNVPTSSFDGYANAEATKKKIIKNCFKNGDLAFLSGDLLVMDEEGYLYFMDRAGDTFRWHGENVSTTEVENIIHKILGLVDCVVYGVDVPGVEGRAGMAAICGIADTFDLQTFYEKVTEGLPSYAIPFFLRVCVDMETTGTFKLCKVHLQKDGFDPNKIKDSLYYLDQKSHSYVKLDETVYKMVVDGAIRM